MTAPPVGQATMGFPQNQDLLLGESSFLGTFNYRPGRNYSELPDSNAALFQGLSRGLLSGVHWIFGDMRFVA